MTEKKSETSVGPRRAQAEQLARGIVCTDADFQTCGETDDSPICPWCARLADRIEQALTKAEHQGRAAERARLKVLGELLQDKPNASQSAPTNSRRPLKEPDHGE